MVRFIDEIEVHQPIIFQGVGSWILVEEGFDNFALPGEELGVGPDIAFIMISEDCFLEEATGEPGGCDIG
jgi:hypothetical protein